MRRRLSQIDFRPCPTSPQPSRESSHGDCQTGSLGGRTVDLHAKDHKMGVSQVRRSCPSVGWCGGICHRQAYRRIITSTLRNHILDSHSLDIGLSYMDVGKSICRFNSSFFGLTASSLLYARLWGMNMGIIDGICHISSNADCDSVSSSNHGNILGFSLAALSLSYFLSQTLCMLFLRGEYALTGMYIVSSIVVIPMSAYSVYAQRKIGKYCVLCIVTLASLAAEAVICISLSNPAIDAGILGTWIIIFATILTILRVVDLLKVKVERGGKERLRFLSLKRKREIISMESRPCDGYETTLSIGPTNAPHTVTTILSTGCPHCRRTVADLLSMQERGIEFHWNIIFGETKSGDSDDVKAMIHAYFSDILLFKKQLKLWSEGRKFRPRDILSDIGSLPVETETYEYFRAFITREGISGLPVIILDGRKLSSVYEVKDLEYLIADNLINNL